MIVITQEVTLHKVEKKSFEGQNKKQVEFYQAKISDEDANSFVLTVDKTIGEKMLTSDKMQGIATIDITKQEKAGKTVDKMKLIGFEEK